MADKRSRMSACRGLVLIGIMAAPLLVAGCGHFSETLQSRQTFEEANLLFRLGS
ncbi:peptidase, partial [bacterium]|nr:peptidase [bacterium]